ncbi:MAG: hypothetical protein ACFCGT_07155 [Sandaracinaceae bacterium]
MSTAGLLVSLGVACGVAPLLRGLLVMLQLRRSDGEPLERAFDGYATDDEGFRWPPESQPLRPVLEIDRPRPWRLFDQLRSELHDPTYALSAVAALLFLLAGMTVGGSWLDTLLGVGLLAAHGSLLRFAIRARRTWPRRVVTATAVSGPTFGGQGTVEIPADGGRRVYLVRWRPMAALLRDGPVDVLVLEEPRGRGGLGVAYRPSRG